MTRYDHLTDAEIEKGIHETDAVLKAERKYVEYLAEGKGLPDDPLARSQTIETHHKIIAKLEKDIEDLFAARTKR